MHNILFSGELVAGYDTDEVKDNFGKLFKITDAAKLDAIFSGKTVTLKKNLDETQARKYEAVLARAGAMCQIDPPLNEISDEDAGLMTTSGDGVNLNTVAMMPTQELTGAQHSEPAAQASPYDAPDAMMTADENTSGQGKAAAVPEGARGLSWGGFLLTPLWGIFNGTYIALLSLIPYVGILVSIWMLVKGREMAWRNKRWDSVERFNKVQKNWATAGLIIVALAIASVILAFVLIIKAASQYSGVSADDAKLEQQLRQVDDPKMRQTMRDLHEAMKQARQADQEYDARDARQADETGQ